MCHVSLKDVDVSSMLREAILLVREQEYGDIHIGEYYHGDRISGDKIRGNKVDGDLIDVGDITDAAGIAIGKGIDLKTK